MNSDYFWIVIILAVLLHDLLVVWIGSRCSSKSSKSLADRIAATRVLHFSLERRVSRLGCAQSEIVRRVESIEGNQR
jgi:hypothetical protein